MSKRSTAKNRTSQTGPHGRQPCPCGSGKRYKACHGAPGGAEDLIVVRSFSGLGAECQLVALREFVPSATAPLPLADPQAGGITLATVLPGAAAAMVRDDGSQLVGLQVQTHSGDVSRDLARAVRWVQQAHPGEVLAVAGPDTAGGQQVRLQDLLATDAPLEVTLHPDFGWWLAGEEPSTAQRDALERANREILPTEAVAGEGVEAAYWVDARTQAHLRWARPEPEETLLAAMARLSARGELDLGEGSRYAGSLRAHGLLVPVWDLDRERHPREWAPGAEALAKRLDDALAGLDTEPLTAAERRARDGLRGRQITIK